MLVDEHLGQLLALPPIRSSSDVAEFVNCTIGHNSGQAAWKVLELQHSSIRSPSQPNNATIDAGGPSNYAQKKIEGIRVISTVPRIQ